MSVLKLDRETGKGGPDFDQCVACGESTGLVSAARLHTVQVNIGLRCNLTCHHCHVNSSPRRKEEMDWRTMEAVLRLAGALDATTLDITGGAPEMHPRFREFVIAAREAGLGVIVRTNLTILLEPGHEETPGFLRDHGVELIASLPCYLEENVDKQRGDGVYGDSIEAIRRLNALGYGVEGGLPLHLVYNPGGPSLPPPQAGLEADYRKALFERFGIRFTGLYTITNVPIGRFRADLRRAHTLDTYLGRLKATFNPGTVGRLMCRHQISVAWDGILYDCDFNLALRLPAPGAQGRSVHEVDPAALLQRTIATGDHCFACTAGAGSSCGGSLV